MTIRWKLVAVLIVPLAALVGLASIGIRDRSAQADGSRAVQQSVLLAGGVSTVADSLEHEAVLSAEVLGSAHRSGVDALTNQRALTDKAVAGIAGLSAKYGASSAVSANIDRAARTLKGLDITRASVDAGGDQGTNALTVYTSTIDRLQEVLAEVATEGQRSPTSTEFSAYASLGRAKAARAEQTALLTLWATGGKLDDQARGRLATLHDHVTTQSEVFLTLADATDKQRFRSATAGTASNDLDAIFQDAMSNNSPSGVARAESAASGMGALRALQRNVEVEIGQLAGSEVAAAESDTRGFMVLAGAALLFALLSASMFGRSITRPMRQLTRAARRVSGEHLPRLLDTVRGNADNDGVLEVEPIILGTRDEMGELAAAFNAIQETAVSVAGEQADMIRRGIGELFVNLARRNQSLLDRQIGFLDELEANERDPDVLADLFKLDHLATRMRRNAESLLVLAGTETPRRWGKPVPLSDVVRAAIGEVEDYARIRIVGLDERPVHGAAAADLAHLLAELLDNASQYSPPDTIVEVHGTAVPGGYRLAVRDHGIGMTQEQRLEANTLLAEPPRTGLHLSRSLGFTVVGRLAQRHAVTVELQTADGTGLLVTISVPSALLVGTTTPGESNTSPSADFDAALADPTILTAAPTPTPTAVTVDAVRVPGPVELSPRATAPVNGHHHQHDEVPARRVVDPEREVPSSRGRPDDVPAAVWARLVGTTDRSNAAAAPVTGWAPSDPVPGAALAPPPARDTLAAPAPPASLAEAVGATALPQNLGEAIAAGARSVGTTSSGLPRRKALEPANVPDESGNEGAVASHRSPEEIRSLLSSYRGGLDRGRRVPVETEQGAIR